MAVAEGQASETQGPEAPAAESAREVEEAPSDEAVEAAPKPKRRRRRKPAAETDGEVPVEAPTETDAAA